MSGFPYDEAACQDLGRLFFEDAIDDEGVPDPDGVRAAQEICASCPVRGACFEYVMDMEGGAAASMRHGVWAGVTPGQRYSIWRRDVLRCIQCGDTYDPTLVVQGTVNCSCGSFSEPVVPIEGDVWYPRHDALLEKLRSYLLTETRAGDRIDPPYKMLVRLGHRRKDDMPRVYERLIADQIIVKGQGRGEYYRGAGRSALASYVPPAHGHRGHVSGPSDRVQIPGSGYPRL